MDVFIALNGHTNNSSLPLRMGMRISEQHQQFAGIKNAIYDEAGTRSQRQNEIDEGRRHYTGILCIPKADPNSNELSELDCRMVLAEPTNAHQSPRVITILRRDSNKGDMTVTRHLEGMLKKGKINVDDLIKIFHPAYVSGELQTSNDCEDVYDKYVRGLGAEIAAGDPVATSMLADPLPIIDLIESTSIQDVELMSPLTSQPLPISGVRYQYVMADAYISDVRVEDDMIKLSCINSRGNPKELHSFKLSPRPHLSSLHKYALNYLKEREGQRALFAICVTEPCVGYIAESVTAISMQMMRQGISQP